MLKKTRLTFSNKEFTVGGFVASVIAVISLMVIVYSVVLSFLNRGLGGEVVGILGLISLVLSFFGFVFGILSYKEQDKRYGYSFFGTFTNGLILIILVLFMLIGI